MVRIRTTKLASNPRGGSARRRKMSPKQIAIFGTKRQKAALKAARRRKRTASAQPRRVQVNSKPRMRHKHRNPLGAVVVTLGKMAAANPRGGQSRRHERRSTTVKAKTKRRNRTVSRPRRRRTATRARRRVAPNTRYRHRARSRNPKVVVRYRTRRRNVRHRRRGSRNPEVFGMRLTGKNALQLIGGGLVGVAAAKFIPTMLPANQLTSTNLGRVVVTTASAFAAGWLAGRVNPTFGGAVLFGGLMQAGSVALNTFLPGFTIGGVPVGLGELMPGQFSVPQNPLRLPPAPAAPATNARIGVNGLARAFGSAY